MLRISTSRNDEHTICDCCKKRGNCDRQESVSGLHKKVIELLKNTLGDIETTASHYRGMAIDIECTHPDFSQYKKPIKEKQEACPLPLSPII